MENRYLRKAKQCIQRIRRNRHLMTRAEEAYLLGAVHYHIDQYKRTNTFESDGWEAMFWDGKWIFEKI